MPLLHKDGYNVSFNAQFLNSIPHLQLTHDGLIPLSNTTFDYGRLSYVNSLLVTFISPLLLLLLIFIIYIVYILLIRTVVEDRFLIVKATLVHKGEDPIEAKKKNDSYKSKKVDYGRCQGAYLFFGVVAVAGAAYGTWLMTDGLNKSDNVLTEFIRVSTHSQETIGNFSQQLLPKPVPAEYEYGEFGPSSLYQAAPAALVLAPPPSPLPQTAFQRWFPGAYQTIATYANYTNSSTANARYFESQFRYTSIAAVAINLTTSFLLLLFWTLFLALSLSRMNVKRHFLLGTVLLLILLTAIFSLNLSGSMALSDFCLSAKPVITDVTVYKIPSNNFTTKFVNYYLYCELNRLNLHQHKNTVTGILDRIGSSISFFNNSKLIQGMVSNVKSGIENTLETVHCNEINRLINEGLGEFCTGPIDGLTLTTTSFIFSIFLLVVTLFTVTFTL